MLNDPERVSHEACSIFAKRKKAKRPLAGSCTYIATPRHPPTILIYSVFKFDLLGFQDLDFLGFQETSLREIADQSAAALRATPRAAPLGISPNLVLNEKTIQVLNITRSHSHEQLRA
jgi:hypothetical protein